MTNDTPVFDRNDTLLGICEAIGQDFGFNPIILRIVLGVSLLWNPLASLGTYAALGIGVLASRILFPPHASVTVQASAAAPLTGDNDGEAHPTAIAA